MTDLLIRSATSNARTALARARAALDLIDTPPAKREPFPFTALIARELTGRDDIPEAVHRQSADFTKRGAAGARGGIVTPVSTMLSRDITSSTSTGTAKGGNLIGDGRLPVARERGQPAVVLSAGAQLITLDAQASMPVMTGTPTASWVGEGSAPSEAAPVFGLRTVAPKTVTAFVNVSRRMVLQSSTAMDQLIENALRRAIGRAIDAAALGAGAANTPTGITGISGVNTVSLSAGALTRGKIGELVEAVAADGCLDFASRPALVVPSAVASKLTRTENASGSGMIADWSASGPMITAAGMPGYVTDGAPAQNAIFGDWSRAALIAFGGIEVLVDPRANAAQGTIRVSAFMDLDFVVEHPEAFAYCTGVSVA